MVQLLRMRFGVPMALPLEAWTCDCKPRGRAAEEDVAFAHAMESHDGGQVMYGVSLADEPLHALTCRWRQGRVIHRHNDVVKALMQGLRGISGVRITGSEPNVGDPAHPQRRADIRMTSGGTVYLLDVGVVCPATWSYVQKHRTHIVPGAAVKQGHARKLQKYGTQSGVKPFMIETGGRLHEEARKFINGLGDQHSVEDKRARAKALRMVGETLVRSQLYMMAGLLADLAERGERWREERRMMRPARRRGDVGHVGEGGDLDAEEETRDEQNLWSDVPFLGGRSD